MYKKSCLDTALGTHTNTQCLHIAKAIHSQSGTSFMRIALKERIDIDNERQKIIDANYIYHT